MNKDLVFDDDPNVTGGRDPASPTVSQPRPYNQVTRSAGRM